MIREATRWNFEKSYFSNVFRYILVIEQSSLWLLKCNANFATEESFDYVIFQSTEIQDKVESRSFLVMVF